MQDTAELQDTTAPLKNTPALVNMPTPRTPRYFPQSVRSVATYLLITTNPNLGYPNQSPTELRTEIKEREIRHYQQYSTVWRRVHACHSLDISEDRGASTVTVQQSNKNCFWTARPLKMEALWSSETSRTARHRPEALNPQQHLQSPTYHTVLHGTMNLHSESQTSHLVCIFKLWSVSGNKIRHNKPSNYYAKTNSRHAREADRYITDWMTLNL
jgi:hypothetical protein